MVRALELGVQPLGQAGVRAQQAAPGAQLPEREGVLARRVKS